MQGNQITVLLNGTVNQRSSDNSGTTLPSFPIKSASSQGSRRSKMASKQSARAATAQETTGYSDDEFAPRSPGPKSPAKSPAKSPTKTPVPQDTEAAPSPSVPGETKDTTA